MVRGKSMYGQEEIKPYHEGEKAERIKLCGLLCILLGKPDFIGTENVLVEQA